MARFEESWTVLRDLIGWLEQSHPGLARWLGGRPDLQLPAIGASVLTHVLLLIALVLVPYAANRDLGTELQSRVVLPELNDFAKIDTTAVADIDTPTSMTPVLGSTAPKLNPLIIQAPTTATNPPDPQLSKVQVALSGRMVLPTVSSLGQSVSIKGNGAEHVGDVEGAVDRIAVEILRRMEKGRTLVVWAFDASGSLPAERQRLAKYIDGVYGHIAELDSEQLAERGGLLTTVVAFGKDRKLMTPEPTADRSAIATAIDAGPPRHQRHRDDLHRPSPTIARKCGRFKRDDQAYQTMVIVVTDEVGDDEDRLEAAIAAAVAAKVPVYVLGSPALFGRVEGYMDYTDPKTGRPSTTCPSARGPRASPPRASACRSGTTARSTTSSTPGFGPYALSRLAGATGGIYFVTRMGGNRPTFDPAGMREYKPDWVSRDQYQAAVAKHPLRAGRHAGLAQITQQNLPGQPSLDLPGGRQAPSSRRRWSRNQEIVARSRVHRRRGALGSRSPPSPRCATTRPRGAGRPTTT